jgi:glycosyltransferase involved in cell wall biosynthesis
MKVLVLASIYPKNDGIVRPMYIHMRNKYYKGHGIDVTVLNFGTKEDYSFEGINVITLATYKRDINKYSFVLLVSHAANIRNHYRFIKKYEYLFQKLAFVFHGHEVLRASTVYPKPFDWKKKSLPHLIIMQDIYDLFKLGVWRKYFPKISFKTHFIFVSKWMYNEFIKNTKINPEVLEGRYSIIYNSVGEKFEKNNYIPSKNLKSDFITVRRNIDGEKYSIDLVNELARHNPNLTFRVIGKGEIFQYIKKADNLIWENRNLNHEEMLAELNTARCALMPTRTDAQGLLMCEMATYGIPVITSDIPVCHEVFDDFSNVELISNDKIDIDLKPMLEKLISGVPYKKHLKYTAINTSGMEARLIKDMITSGVR